MLIYFVDIVCDLSELLDFNSIGSMTVFLSLETTLLNVSLFVYGEMTLSTLSTF